MKKKISHMLNDEMNEINFKDKKSRNKMFFVENKALVPM
jgi:hypothetical protein